MIIGSCPYPDCDALFDMPLAEHAPCYSKDTCEKCGRSFWTLHSRFRPKSWTEEGFKEIADVDEEKHTIELKNGLTPDDIYLL